MQNQHCSVHYYLPDIKDRLNVQHLLKVFLGTKLFVKKRICTLNIIKKRLSRESYHRSITAARTRKMKLLNDEEIFLCDISKRIYQFEQHMKPVFISNKNLLKALRMDSNLLEFFHKFGQNLPADDIIGEEGKITNEMYAFFVYLSNLTNCRFTMVCDIKIGRHRPTCGN